jgi:hypothetical protein
LAAVSNSGLQLRRSKRLAKDSPASIDYELVQNEFVELPASPGGQASDTVIDNEATHWGTVESRRGTPTSHMQATITNSEPTESDHDEQDAGSPDHSLSESPDIDRIINNICPSPSPRHKVPEPGSNELDSRHLTTLPSHSLLDLSDPEQFACNYIPSEVRKALSDLGSNSLFEHTMSQASSSEACPRDLTDSEGDDPSFSSRQNVGNLRLRCPSLMLLCVAILQNYPSYREFLFLVNRRNIYCSNDKWSNEISNISFPLTILSCCSHVGLMILALIGLLSGWILALYTLFFLHGRTHSVSNIVE